MQKQVDPKKMHRLDTIKKPDTGQFTRLIKRTKLEMSKISLRPGAKLYISGKREWSGLHLYISNLNLAKPVVN